MTSPRRPARSRFSRTKPVDPCEELDEDDHLDGCDVEFLDSEATPDAELPAASGGVETARGKASRRSSAVRRRKKR